jgi:hypothetical protein
LRSAVLFFTLSCFLRAGVALAAGDTVIRDLSNTKIIRSQEKPHNILNDACIACHPKEKFDFWLLIYKGNPPSITVDRPADKGTVPAGTTETAAAPGNRYNSHDAVGCNLCHFGNPTSAAPKFIMDLTDLCRLCHPSTEIHHLPGVEDLLRIKESIAAGKLPGRDGNLLCTTCHKIHDSVYGMRNAYTQTLWQGKVPNPHGGRAFCFVCHQVPIREGEEIRFAGGKENIALCNECHLRPGIRRAPHVVDVGSKEGTWRMDYLGYPLKQGKLVCSTCHDEVSHGKKDPANPRFLRGGPYTDNDAFCYRCHLEDREQRNNPHRQIDGFGRIRREACRVCHKNDPDTSKSLPANRAMVGEESAICAMCHELRPHPSVNHMVRLPQNMVRLKDEYEKRHQVTLPLREDGFIQCSTCHNPHAKGILKGAAGVGGGSRYRVPDFREMCAPCHTRY